MIPVQKCGVCDSPELRPYALDAWSSQKLHFAQAQCVRCGLLISQPQASFDEMKRFYESEYYQILWPDPELVWNENSHYYREYELSMMKKLWSDWPPPSEGGTLTEIGCGYGVMLRIMQDEGFRVRGCDVSQKAVESCRALGLDVEQGLSREPEPPSDIALAFHVIEHVADPRRFAELLLSKVRPGGLAIVATEDAWISQYAFERTLARLSGKIPSFRTANDHTYVFRAEHLVTLFKNAGASDVRVGAFSYLPLKESLHWKMYKGLFRTIDRLTGHGDYLLAVARRGE